VTGSGGIIRLRTRDGHLGRRSNVADDWRGAESMRRPNYIAPQNCAHQGTVERGHSAARRVEHVDQRSRQLNARHAAARHVGTLTSAESTRPGCPWTLHHSRFIPQNTSPRKMSLFVRHVRTTSRVLYGHSRWSWLLLPCVGRQMNESATDFFSKRVSFRATAEWIWMDLSNESLLTN